LIPFPKKKYKTIVIDPPWPINFIKRRERPKQTAMPYKLMPLEEIYNLPIPKISNKNTSLFLWTTNKFLHEAFHLLKHWGFKYNSTLVWDKNNGMVMFGVRRRVEFVLFGYKGETSFYMKGEPLESFFYEKGKQNSVKPRIFYDKLLKHTKEPRIDLFARKTHYGFDVWGDEVEQIQPLEAFN